MNLENIDIRALKYSEPTVILEKLKGAGDEVALHKIIPEAREMGVSEERTVEEWRQFAMFCIGMAGILQCRCFFADMNDEDYDFILLWFVEDKVSYTPVKLLGLEPGDMDEADAFLLEVEHLVNLEDVDTLCVAVNLNKGFEFDPRKVELPELPVGELWAFGTKSSDENLHYMFGNLLENPKGFSFDNPVPE